MTLPPRSNLSNLTCYQMFDRFAFDCVTTPRISANSCRIFLAKLVKDGMANNNPTSPSACAALLVPNPGLVVFSFTVDLRPVNRFTISHQIPMPNLEQELTKIAGSKIYSTADFSHGYRQLQLVPASQESQSFITPDGFMYPIRVLHGNINAVMYLQSTLSSNFPDELRLYLLWWLNDILIHSTAIDNHLNDVRRLLQFCVVYNFKMHPSKCRLFHLSFRWCGRHISDAGTRLDPRRINGNLDWSTPTNGA